MGTIVVCALLGMLGGIANCLLLDNGFALPRLIQVGENKRVWNPGFFGNVLLGGIAALVVYFLGGSALPQANQWGVSLVSGIGGASLPNVDPKKTLAAEIDATGKKVRELAEALRAARTNYEAELVGIELRALAEYMSSIRQISV